MEANRYGKLLAVAIITRRFKTSFIIYFFTIFVLVDCDIPSQSLRESETNSHSRK